MIFDPDTGMPLDVVPFEELAEKIRCFHADRWARWFRFVPYQEPEIVSYSEEELLARNHHLTPSYIPAKQRIMIPLPKGGLTRNEADEYADPESAARYEQVSQRYAWSLWQVEMTEEICHEFQHRAINDGVDKYGEYLFAAYGPFGKVKDGHTEGFSTAVAQFGATFGLDPHRLVRTLWQGRFELCSQAADDPWGKYTSGRILPEADIKIAAFLRYRRWRKLVAGDNMLTLNAVPVFLVKTINNRGSTLSRGRAVTIST